MSRALKWEFIMGCHCKNLENGIPIVQKEAKCEQRKTSPFPPWSLLVSQSEASRDVCSCLTSSISLLLIL